MKQILTFLFTLLSASLTWAQPSQITNTPIKHVVVVFQENISFDHYFATYPVAANNNSSEPSFIAAPNTPSVNGLGGPLLTNNPNAAQPFRLSRAQALTCDQGHNYGDEQKAFNHGLMNKFVESVGKSSASCDIGGYGKTIVMGYYDGNTVTAFWNYAQNFAMNDNSFGTTFGPSTPGAVNLIAGQTHGVNVISGSTTGIVGSSGSLIGDARPPASLDDCTTQTSTKIIMSGQNVGDLLNAKGVTWGWFQGGFKPSSVSADGMATCATVHKNIAGVSITDYVPHHDPFQLYQSTASQHHLPPSSVAMIGQSDRANHQYDTSDFFNALGAGVLPAVSYLKAAAYQDGHASNSDPLDEQTWIVTIINAIMQSPFWSSTAIIIGYDDSDGWYDHVMPPIVIQSSTTDDSLTGSGACGDGTSFIYQGRCGYGPRMPLLVISPYSRVNFVDHTVTDQSSILRFIEDNWGLGRIGDASSDAYAGSLLNMFDFQNHGPAKAILLDPATGLVASPMVPSPGVSTGTTKAVANPKGASTLARQFMLDGGASTSFDGKPLLYQWTMASGSPVAAINFANTAAPAIQFGSGFGTYVFVLTVTDSAGNTATDNATVTYLGR